jgi:hypothetical protein
MGGIKWIPLKLRREDWSVSLTVAISEQFRPEVRYFNAALLGESMHDGVLAAPDAEVIVQVCISLNSIVRVYTSVEPEFKFTQHLVKASQLIISLNSGSTLV